MMFALGYKRLHPAVRPMIEDERREAWERKAAAPVSLEAAKQEVEFLEMKLAEYLARGGLIEKLPEQAAHKLGGGIRATVQETFRNHREAG